MRPKRPFTPEQAAEYAERLCSAAEYSSGEILRKLTLKGLPAAQAQRVIDGLIELRFIDDSRFAALFARNKVEYSGWGRRKIAAALYQKGIDRATIDAALDGIDPESYRRRLTELIDRKRRTMPDADTYEGRARLFRFAASHGFEPDLIMSAIKTD